MDWIQFSLFILALSGMYFFLKSDSKEGQKKTSEDRKEIIAIMRSQEKDSRDFHGRLCALEEKYVQMMERFINNKTT